MGEFIWYNCSAVCGSSAQQLYGGVNGDLLQEGLHHTLCDPGQLHLELLPLLQATADLHVCRRHSNPQRQTWLSFCRVSGSWCTQVLLEPSKCPWQVWDLILNMILLLLLSFWGFSFAFGLGASFFGGIQHSSVNGCSAVSCNFGVLTEKMSTYPSTPLSWFKRRVQNVTLGCNLKNDRMASVHFQGKHTVPQ